MESRLESTTDATGAADDQDPAPTPSRPPRSGPDGRRRPDEEYLADYYRWLADAEFRDHDPLYERVARAMADEPALLDRLAPLAEPKFVPVLVNAAVHDLVLREPDQPLAAVYRAGEGDPWPAYRALLVERFDELADLVRHRSIQTNEVGRVAALLPALAEVHRGAGRPLALVELGPSAGLNLLLDRYGVTYRDRSGRALRTVGPATSPVQLDCDLLGETPALGATAPPIAWRVGLDRRPIDVRDPAARRWLQACLWPSARDRGRRLEAALSIAVDDPPDVRAGDAVAGLADLLGEAPPTLQVVVAATWVLAYLDDDQRRSLAEVLAGAGRPVAMVTGEYPGVAPWVPDPPRPPHAAAGTGATLVGLGRWDRGAVDARALAWMQAHGRWLDWFAPG